MPGDDGIFALRVDHQHAALGGEQVGNDGADALAGAGRGDGDQVRRAAIAEQAAPAPVLAADEKPVPAVIRRTALRSIHRAEPNVVAAPVRRARSTVVTATSAIQMTGTATLNTT